jgi:curved DNA-binding protein CbpA
VAPVSRYTSVHAAWMARVNSRRLACTLLTSSVVPAVELVGIQRCCLWCGRSAATTLAVSRGLHCSSSTRVWVSAVPQASPRPSAWCTARRYASVGRRPTFLEVSEALDVLGVTIDEDPKVVKTKYRELVKKNHPDAGGDEATMARVTVAYERLSGLSQREKEEYRMQKKAFHSGGVTGARRYRPGPAGGFGYAAPQSPFNARTANMYSQYYQQDANTAYQQAHQTGQSSYWNQYHNRAGSTGFTENPFNFSNPFSMNAQAQRARFMPTATLLLQGLVVYLVFSAFFLFIYRRYRDWRHDDGWRMSESLARHEQMQEMHRIRQEMNERARAMLMRDGGDTGVLPGVNNLYGNRQYVGESAEARALEYARQRRIQMMQEQQEAAINAPELRGWPRVEEEKGRIIKRAQDPPGVVFFEPRSEDARRRQIENQRRANGFTRRTEANPPTPTSTPPAAATGAAAAESTYAGTGVNGSPRLPPETNVGSIVMKPVGSEQEAQAVMRGIFAGLRHSSSQP